MTTAQTETRDDHGRGNAVAWFQNIVEMVDRLRTKRDGDSGQAHGDAINAIQESVLSVEVRSDWYVPGTAGKWRNDTPRGQTLDSPAEYRILLTWGGPAAQLTGELSEHGEPETARLEFQDWGTPWTEISPRSLAITSTSPDPSFNAIEKARTYLLDFARQFYFGEG